MTQFELQSLRYRSNPARLLIHEFAAATRIPEASQR